LKLDGQNLFSLFSTLYTHSFISAKKILREYELSHDRMLQGVSLAAKDRPWKVEIPVKVQ